MAVIEHFPLETLDFPENEKLIFLMGPIQGAPNWQKYATEKITEIHESRSTSTLHIANPRREYMGDFDYDAQVKWEKTNIWKSRSLKSGAILCWFAAQDFSLPYEEGREFAKTTKDEVMRTIGWMDYDPTISLHVGIEPGFESLSRYKRACLEEHALGRHTNLDELCRYIMNNCIER